MKENELIKAIDAIYEIGKDKQNKETYQKKADLKNIDNQFDGLLKEEMAKLKKQDEKRQEQLNRLREEKTYANILQNIYEKNNKITKNK